MIGERRENDPGRYDDKVPGTDRLTELRRFLAYDAWANGATLSSLEAARQVPPAALARMGHLVGAGRLWLGRLLGEPPAIVWPALDLAGCRAGLEELAERWQSYLAGMVPGTLEQGVDEVPGTREMVPGTQPARVAGSRSVEGGGGQVPGTWGRVPGTLEGVVRYVNSAGEGWSSRVEDVLMQVILHGAYHRGQIAADLRAVGAEPAYTDFIEAARRGLLPEP